MARTVELDELHHDVGMPAMAEALGAMRGTSRRTFLLGAGAAVAGGAAVAVGSGALPHAGCGLDPSAVVGVKASAFPPAGLKGDLAVAAVAASLENLAVFAYTAGLTAATQGKLGTVPPAVATFATTVKGQHQQHADAWNAVLKSHGKAPVTVTNPTLTPTVQSDFAKVTDITGLGAAGRDPRDDCGPDLSGRDVEAEEQRGHSAVVLHSTGGDAAHRHPLLRARHVPRRADLLGHAAGVQPDVPGGLSCAGTDTTVQGWCARPGPGGRTAPGRVQRRRVGLVGFGLVEYVDVGSRRGATSSNAITISNFMFSPMSVSVAPGSTVT